MLLFLILFLILDLVNNATHLKRLRPFFILAIAFFVIGILFKILHWRFAHEILLIGHIIIPVLYLFQLLMRKYKPSEETAKLVFVILFTILSLSYIYHWPYKDELTFATAAAFIVYFAILGVKYLRRKRLKDKE